MVVGEDVVLLQPISVDPRVRHPVVLQMHIRAIGAVTGLVLEFLADELDWPVVAEQIMRVYETVTLGGQKVRAAS